MTTLSELREKVRERADQQNSQFITEPELSGYINNSYAELYDILISKFQDYYCKDPVSFSLTSLNYYPIPADLYKIRGIDVMVGANWATVFPFNFIERNTYVSFNRPILKYPKVKYRLMGQKLIFTPADQAPGDYQLWYIPRYTPLSADSDILSDVMDYEEYVIVDAAIKCMIKEETDPSALLMIKQGLKQRIEGMASNRDSGMPQTISDVRGGYGYGYGFNAGMGWF
jgi:hypothetical protein